MVSNVDENQEQLKLIKWAGISSSKLGKEWSKHWLVNRDQTHVLKYNNRRKKTSLTGKGHFSILNQIYHFPIGMKDNFVEQQRWQPFFFYYVQKYCVYPRPLYNPRPTNGLHPKKNWKDSKRGNLNRKMNQNGTNLTNILT